jgi:mono/diheme cytochrome c family protein
VVPDLQPSAVRAEKLAVNLDLSKFTEPGNYRANSPYQVFEALAETKLSDVERWDLVAYVWQAKTTPAALANGRELYAQNCAACHGESGGGDGVFADDLAAAGEASMTSMGGSMAMAMQAPADLSEAEHILGASPALLEGKILRGGMGTGMPMWGSVLTQEQIWDMVAYLYSFQFEYESEVQ